MSAKENIVIKDACILVDLIDLNLMEDFFKLNVTPVTTIFVVGEILDNEQALVVQSYIERGALFVYGDGDVETITLLNEQRRGLSFADCSVLELSFRIPGIILSSDKILRNEAKRRNIIVKGLLWVINQLFEQKIKSKEECLEKLELYPQINPRAPKNDIQLLIDKIKNT